MFAPIPAAADLPQATSEANCGIDSAFACSYQGASVVISQSPFAAIGVHVNSDGTFETGGSGGQGTLNYYFEVLGPATSSLVPVFINFNLHQDTFNGAVAVAQISATAGGFFPGDSAGAVICSVGMCADNSSDLGGDLVVHSQVGYVGSIYMNAAITQFPHLQGVTGGYASVDPFIRVDPSFADAADYSIILSPGVANGIPSVVAVPEPETWMMLIAGALGISTVVRKRRRS